MSTRYLPLTPAAAVFNDDGIPFSPEYGDVYHSASGALAQADHVFIKGNGLPERWRGHARFTVCETGFGLGNNFLALWQAWRDDPQRPERLHVLSFEAHPFSREDLAKILLNRHDRAMRALAQRLIDVWPPLLPGIHRLEFEEGRLTLTLAFGPIQTMAKKVEASVDAFFLDGFAPRVNPDMWSRSLFGQLVRMSRPGATAASWCCAGEVRRNLSAAGFLVSKAAGFAGKREMMVAQLRPQLGRKMAAPRAPTSVTVVGSGLAGAGVARGLARRGHHVIIVDPNLLRDGAGRHAGHLAAAMTPAISPDDDMRARLSRAGVLRAMALARDLPVEARPWRCGTLQPASSADEAAKQRKMLAALQFPDEWVRWLDSAAAHELSGHHLAHGGLWFGVGHLVRPDVYVKALLNHGNIQPVPRAVQAIQRDAEGRWSVIDASGTRLALTDQLVIAAGPDTPGLLAGLPQGLDLPRMMAMQKLAGQVSYVAAEALSVKAIVAGDGYCLPPVAGSTVVGSTYELEADGARRSDAGDREILCRTARLLQKPDQAAQWLAAVQGGWAGWRAAMSDHLPVIGRASGLSGLWVACAYGSRGLTWASLAGDVIGAQLNSEPIPLERDLLIKLAPR